MAGPVLGNLLVGKNASVLAGCDTIYITVFVTNGPPQTVPSFPCFDDPNPKAPTLSSHDAVRGNLIADQALGVRQPLLILLLLSRPCDHPETELIHTHSPHGSLALP